MSVNKSPFIHNKENSSMYTPTSTKKGSKILETWVLKEKKSLTLAAVGVHTITVKKKKKKFSPRCPWREDKKKNASCEPKIKVMPLLFKQEKFDFNMTSAPFFLWRRDCLCSVTDVEQFNWS